MGIHKFPLIVRSCKWIDISSFIHTLRDVLRYLVTHWHQWWDFLALVNDIHQWSVIQWILSMFDIDTFICMTRIVTSSFCSGWRLYILSQDSINSWRNTTSDLWVHHNSTFFLPHFPLFISSSSNSSTSHYNSYSRNNIYSYIFILQQWHILHDSAAAVPIPSLPMI